MPRTSAKNCVDIFPTSFDSSRRRKLFQYVPVPVNAAHHRNAFCFRYVLVSHLAATVPLCKITPIYAHFQIYLLKVLNRWGTDHPLPFPSLPFTSLHFPSLHFTSLPFTLLHFASRPFPSLHFPSLCFTLLPGPSLRFTSLRW